MAKKKRLLKNEPGLSYIMKIKPHLVVLLLRKSVGKLIEYINLHEYSSIARNEIIHKKYLLSQCRPEILNIFISLSVRIEQMDFSRTWEADRVIYMLDTASDTTFKCHHTIKDEFIHEYSYIAGRRAFTNMEALLFRDILVSLHHMHENKRNIIMGVRETAAIEKIFDMYQPRR